MTTFTSCTRCKRQDLPVLPGSRYIAAAHVAFKERPCLDWVQHEALNRLRIQQIWNDDNMWDL